MFEDRTGVKLNTIEQTEYLAFAKDLALKSGNIISTNFGKTFATETKSDLSPVTAIDKQINQLVSETIKRRYPSHGLQGEEADLGTGDEEFQWLCDPLDGTVPFILGMPNSVFMLALTHEGRVQVSVVYDPYTDKMYSAIKGQGAFCNDLPIHVNDQPLEGGFVLLDISAYPCAKGIKAAGGRVEPVSGTGYKCMMIARGSGSGAIKFDADYHDIGPASLIIEEAGGKVTDITGSPMRFNKKINGAIVSNGVAHEALVRIALEAQQG